MRRVKHPYEKFWLIWLATTLRGGENEAIRESLLRAENLPHHITQALLKPSYSACDVNTDKII